MTDKDYARNSTIESFLNSFVRDYEGTESYKIKNNQLIIKTKEGELKTPLLKNSKLYHHKYTHLFLFQNCKISFYDFLEIFSREYCSKESKDFISKVLESEENIRNALENVPALDIQNYLDSEKKLVRGHPFHPWPKLKRGMTPQEIDQFAPEFTGSFKLKWVHINAKLVDGEIYKTALKQMQEFDSIKDSPDHVAIPFHPWQWEQVWRSQVLEKEDVIKSEEGKNTFYALSSMRSFYHPDAPWGLKSSLKIQLTNSLRTLEIDEVKRGARLATVISGEKLLPTDSKLHLLKEPSYLYLKTPKGEIINDSIIQFRDNFHQKKNLSNLYLLSSYIEKHPIENKSLLEQQLDSIVRQHSQNHTYAKKLWLSMFLDNILSPILDLALKEGLLVGAHLQNLIIETDQNLPSKVYYRDFQGSGFTVELTQKLSHKYPQCFQDKKVILNQDEIKKVFGYYLIVNTAFSVISALAASDSREELLYLSDLRNYIWKKNIHSPHSFYDYLLYSPTLSQKGNMRCSLLQLNEATAAAPWEIYNTIQNPISSLRPIELLYKKESPLYEAYTRKNNKLSIRSLTRDDLELFHRWHHQDYVKEFWELGLTKAEHQKLIENLINNPYEDPLIVEMNGHPFAYYQVYWAFEDRIAPYCGPSPYDRGLHLLIGEPKYLRTRHVYDSMLHVSKFLFEQNLNTQRIWAEPRSDNHKIMRFCEKLPGWSFIKEFDFPHKRSALLKCEKELFDKELENAL